MYSLGRAKSKVKPNIVLYNKSKALMMHKYKNKKIAINQAIYRWSFSEKEESGRLNNNSNILFHCYNILYNIATMT